jgi:hypothetical protein
MGDVFGETILEVGTAESRRGGSGQRSVVRGQGERRGTMDFAKGTSGRDEAVGVEAADFAGGFGGGESRLERCGEVNDIDINHLPIDWVGDSKNLNIKKINESESSCWNLDFMGFGRHSEGDWVRENIAFGDIESY